MAERDGDAAWEQIVAQYATQRLEESGEAARVRAAFASAMTARVAAAEPHFTTRARRQAFAQRGQAPGEVPVHLQQRARSIAGSEDSPSHFPPDWRHS